jgi:hypothetical protein
MQWQLRHDVSAGTQNRRNQPDPEKDLDISLPAPLGARSRPAGPDRVLQQTARSVSACRNNRIEDQRQALAHAAA